MMNDYGGQIVKMTVLSAQLYACNAAHDERRHIERFHRKVHLCVHLRTIGITPPKSFNVKAQHLEMEDEI